MLHELEDTLDFGCTDTFDAELSESIRGLTGSEILRIAADIRARVAAGESVCNLTVGDFDAKQFPIPDALAREIGRAYAEGETNYPPSNGVPALREAVAARMARDWGVKYGADSVLVTAGARPAIYGAYGAVVDPGDTVVYPVPSWNNNHYAYLFRANGVAVRTEAENDFMPTVDDLRPYLRDARLLCINTPQNPGGTILGADAARDIAVAIVEENERRRRAGERALFLMLDLVYGTVVHGETPQVHPVKLEPRLAPWAFTVDGISKGYAATGLRVGWVVAPPQAAKRMNALIGHVGAWAPRPEQVATARFLSDDDAVAAARDETNGRVKERIDLLYEGFRTLRAEGYPVECIAPAGALYLSLRLDWFGRTLDGETVTTNEHIRSALLDRAAIAVVPFQAFGFDGDSGWFRLSVGAISCDDARAMMPRLRTLMDTLGRPESSEG